MLKEKQRFISVYIRLGASLKLLLLLKKNCFGINMQKTNVKEISRGFGFTESRLML